MNKLLFTVRSTLNQLNNLVTSFHKPALLLGPVLFSFLFSIISVANANTVPVIRIALIDTGFCPVKKSGVIIHPSIDLTASVSAIDCKRPDLKSPRMHGQHVLLEFLKHVDLKKIRPEIFPLIVFDLKGNQQKDYWLKAIEWVKTNKIDVVLTAAGFLVKADELKSLSATELPALWFVPSGRIGPGIKEKTDLFPQSMAPAKNLFLIGDYYDGKMIIYDQGLLYKDKIDYFFPSGTGAFTGTSRAVAEAAAKALKLCSVSEMRECLQKQSKEFIDGFNQKKIKTY